ncbi:sugar transferase [Octadecabacter sp. 1_MG-2023]|uniref:sugar transferase n=1 Tax=unclassified Octadecabacter TaxID=196158 RepID=UPI001C087A89|nr:MULTISPECIES: sugar transferase [unclassified Octadecabacter]MBU2993991.1 sugar transferase [Octadecabacter sp. B2R22]MDO6736066.1 sugar transferase [Octadecabacter sp. 1_MG-2023]
MSVFSTDLVVREDTSAVTSITQKHSSLYRTVGKRIFDLTLVLSTLVITIPVIALMALAVLVSGQLPFYVQKRVGLNGKTFRMLKVQTMLPNADQLLETHLANNPDARAEWDSKQKLMNDPRITPVGAFLRKTSLDELPQLLNVLTGSMSLVGPRPIMLSQNEQYSGTAYYLQRPGMTGLWQISDRNTCEFSGRVRFDEIYNRKLSLGTDVNVILRTVGVMLRGTGC